MLKTKAKDFKKCPRGQRRPRGLHLSYVEFQAEYLWKDRIMKDRITANLILHDCLIAFEARLILPSIHFRY